MSDLDDIFEQYRDADALRSVPFRPDQFSQLQTDLDGEQYGMVGEIAVPVGREPSPAPASAEIPSRLNPPDVTSALNSIYSEYPALKDWGVDVIDSRGEAGKDGYLEFYHPDESRSPNPGKPTVELFSPELKGNFLSSAIFGDMLHYAPDVNPEFARLREGFRSTLTPEQKAIDRRAYERARQEYGEDRPFDDWFDISRLDAYIRGYLAPDPNNEWADAYTPEQRELLERMRTSLRSPAKKDSANILAAPAPQAEENNGFEIGGVPIGDIETALNAPFAGIARGVLKFVGNTAAAFGLVDQAKVDRFFDAADRITTDVQQDNLPAQILGTAGEIYGQYGVAARGGKRLLRAAGASPFVATLVSDSLVGLLGISPNDEALANMLSENASHPAVVALRDLLATDPDDPEWVNRSRNAVEAFALLGMSEAVVRSLPEIVRQTKQFVLTEFGQGLERLSNTGRAADERITELSRGGTMMANPIGAATDVVVSGAGKVADLIMAPTGARAHKLPHNLLVEGSGATPTYKVTQSFGAANKEANFAAIDAAKAAHPDALKSAEDWSALLQDTMGGSYLPVPPMQAIKYAQSPQVMADKLAQLTPEMKEGVDAGFANVSVLRDMYRSGEATPRTTTELFVWGILSRGAGPVQQESAYIDIIGSAGELIEKVTNGTFSAADEAIWRTTMSKALPAGSPGRQVTMNVNAAGKLLLELASTPPNSSETVLQTLHRMIGDEQASAAEIRRTFMNLTDKAGIDNKVVSFILLVSGRDDVLVMDRIQSRHLWDDGRFDGFNIYDGYMKEGTTAAEGLHGVMRGPRGLLVTEALEDGLRPMVQEAYRLVGREGDASLGRFHWETWVIDGEQVVDHGTLKAVATGNPIGTGVSEGKPGTFSSGMRYTRGTKGPVIEYPLSDGSSVYLTPDRMKQFEKYIKNPKNGIVPRGFKVTERTDVRWYERPEVDREALDAAARDYQNAGPDG